MLSENEQIETECKKCMVLGCSWDAHPLYEGLCENHYIDHTCVPYYYKNGNYPIYPRPEEDQMDSTRFIYTNRLN